MGFFGDLSPEQLTLLSTAVAIALSDGLSPGETNDLGNFLSAVGQSLQLMSAHQQLLGSEESCKSLNTSRT